MNLRVTSGTVLCIVLMANAMAQEPPKSGAQQDGWSGKAALGYLATSGNSESSSLNSQLEVGYESGSWKHLLEASAISAQEDEVSSAEAYKLGIKTEYTFSPDNYLFGRVIWRKDLFSGYNQQLSETVGYGRRLVDTPAHQLSAEIGAGARQSEPQDGVSEDDVIVRGAANYQWIISKSATFSQVLSIESGELNTYLESVTALKARVIGNFALVASYTIKNNSDVPVDTERTDTYTALSIEYAFK